MNRLPSLLAVEVGSSRVKLGWFPDDSVAPTQNGWPEPIAVYREEHRGRPDQMWTAQVDDRLDELSLPAETLCVVASVHQAAAETLFRTSLARRSWSRLVMLRASDLPLTVRVKEPTRVGIDRLLGAIAANRLRDAARPAIVVDMGTATTVNLISADGAFEGGAILAGPVTALAALHASTVSLPLMGPEALHRASPVGKSTEGAMASGGYWGAIGAGRELIKRIAADCSSRPEVFLTGGAALPFAEYLGLDDEPARHVPNLVLAGIRLAAEHLAES